MLNLNKLLLNIVSMTFLLCSHFSTQGQVSSVDSLKSNYIEQPNSQTAFKLLERYIQTEKDSAFQYFSKIQTDQLSQDQLLKYRQYKGDIYSSQLQYDSAVQVYTELLEDIVDSNKFDLIADINDKIGNVYIQLREKEQATTYFTEAINIRETNNLKSDLPKSYYAFGNIQFRDKKNNQAISSYRKGIQSISGEGQVPLLANLNYMLGNCYSVSQNLDSAKYYFTQAKALYDNIGADQLQIAVSNELASLLVKSQDYDEAIPILENNIELIKKFSDWQYYNRSYDLLVAANEGLKDYEKALFYMKHRYDTTLKFLVSQRTESVAKITEDFRTDKQLDKAEEQAVFATRRAKIFGTIIGILAIILIITHLLFTRAIQKKQLENLQAMVLGEENERKRVAKDLHDGIGVLLTSVKLRLSNFQDKVEAKQDFKNSLDQIDNACAEVRRISHNMIPASLTKLGLQEAILDLLDNVQASTNILIEESLDYEEGAYDESKEVLIYRVIQELVNNSLKYADPTKLSIKLHKSNQDYLLTYSDNGMGFEKSKVKSGLGLRSIASRVDILKGKFTFESSPSQGTIFNIAIPHHG